MKKQRKTSPKKKKSAAASEPARGASETVSRRSFLRFARNAAIALPVLGGVGFLSVRSAQATICEADMTKIGKGRPAVVQIHDPACPQCQTLQRQTRRALRPYDDDEVVFLVADIKTARGGAFALRHGVGHVTLLLFDPEGTLQRVVQGPQNMETLRGILDAHVQSYA